MTMKALSLTQPWASLVALGQKRIETRSWGTKYRGHLAIHATAGFALIEGEGRIQRIGERLSVGPFEVERDPAGLLLRSERLAWPYRLPQGAIVATVILADCRKIYGYNHPCGPLLTGQFNREQEQAWSEAMNVAHLGDVSDRAEDEYAFGNYTPGRYAWLLSSVIPLKDPIPCKGGLGLWDWEQS